jgi:hypothetical protein
MVKETSSRICLACRKTIKGRTDKKFCDDFCRNDYNNHLKSGDNNYVRNINNALRKNRRIMAALLEGAPEGKIVLSKDSLSLKGFEFKYMTHTSTYTEGKTYYFCYDYGYLPLDSNRYLLVRKEKSPGRAGAIIKAIK